MYLREPKLNPEKAAEIRLLYMFGCSQKEIAVRYGVTPAAIHHVINNKVYKGVPTAYELWKNLWKGEKDGG